MVPTMHLKVEPIYLELSGYRYGADGEILPERHITGYRTLQWWSEHGLAEGDKFETGGTRPMTCLGMDGKSFPIETYTTWQETEVGEWRYLEGTVP